MSGFSVPIYVMANDVVVPELVRLLASVRKHAPNTAVRVIAFNDNFMLCRRVTEVFGFQVDNNDLSSLDAFGHAIFDEAPPQQPYPYMLGKIRKLVVFQQSTPAIYLDVDTILVSHLFEIASKALDSEFDLGFVSSSKNWVYENVDEAQPLLANSKQFSSSFLLSRPGVMNFDLIRDTLLREKKLYLKVRKNGVIDQPLLNFVADVNRINVKSIPDLLNLSAHTVATYDQPSFRVKLNSSGEVIQNFQGQEKQILFLHAAGQYKHHWEYDFLFKSALYDGLMFIFREDKALGAKLFDSIDAWRP